MKPTGIMRSKWLIAAIIGLSGVAHASNNPAMDTQVMRINNEWARIKYTLPNKSAQYHQLEILAGQAAAVVAKYPGKAEPLLWQGIVTSEEAAQASVFSQLSLATSARNILQKAYAIDPRAENGGVAMSLGVLYYKVLGWPIGFGNAKKAKALLDAALAQDPNGLDSNFFYGDYLFSQSDNAGAKAHLQKALRAPANPNRPTWDSGRRAEARALLARIR